MECPICFTDYRLDSVTVIKLSCCHTLCKPCCLSQLNIECQISCPLCLKKTNKDSILIECETIKKIKNLSYVSEQDDSKTWKSHSVLLRNLRGHFAELDLNESMTVYNLKQRIQDIEGIPIASQWLLLNGQALENDKNIFDYEIKPKDTIYLVMRSFGG